MNRASEQFRDVFYLILRQISSGKGIATLHLIRWVERGLREIQGELQAAWIWVMECIRQLVRELPATGQAELFALYEQLPAERKARSARASPLYRLRHMALRLSEH